MSNHKAPTHIKLEQDIIRMSALLEINVSLHHFASLKDGRPLGDTAIAGLGDIQGCIIDEANEHLKQLFAEHHESKKHQKN